MGRFLGEAVGALNYPEYQVWRTRAVWRSRQEVEEYVAALQLGAAVDDLVEVGVGVGGSVCCIAT